MLAATTRKSSHGLRIADAILLALTLPAYVAGFLLGIFFVKRWGSNAGGAARTFGALALAIAATVYLGRDEILIGIALGVPVAATIARFVLGIAIKARDGGLA